jgi:serine protease Do
MSMGSRRLITARWLPILIIIVALIGLASCQAVSGTVAPPTPVDFTSAVAKVIPSIVVIEAEGDVQLSSGSGWIVGANGLIVTNNHVIEKAHTITITLSDARKFTATVVKADAAADLAVVKIDAQNLKVASVGDSAQLQLGQPVAVIGNALNLGVRVTGGLVSQLGVTVSLPSGQACCLIETDASINPGNSGGVLITTAGDVVGVVNAGLDDPRVDVEDFGYAIPVNTAMPIINQLIAQMP